MDFINQIERSPYREVPSKSSYQDTSSERRANESPANLTATKTIKEVKAARSTDVSQYQPPAHIQAIYEKCHIVRKIVDKAMTTNFIGYHGRVSLLHVFQVMGEDGARYIHHVMSYCMNYDFAITQKHIDNCNCTNPIGCRKLAERFEDIYGKTDCKCNFPNADMFLSPIIHARRILPACFKPQKSTEKTSRIKQSSSKRGAEDILGKLMSLNRQAYEINGQQKMYAGQLESLFTRTEITEIQTPQGLLIRNENGFFIKVG